MDPNDPDKSLHGAFWGMIIGLAFWGLIFLALYLWVVDGTGAG